jgi:trimeric autotransporter adhesin
MIDRRGLNFYATLGMVAFMLVSLVSCSGFFPSSSTITALSVSPTGPFVKPQATQQFSATATFGNNTMGDATDKVTWTSSSTGVATISTAGLATGVAVGTTTITAKSGSVSANTVLTVSNRTVTGIAVSPATATINFSFGGQTQQAFTAQATFDDGSGMNVTTLAGWTSSNTSVATINNNGVATAVTTGTVTITASYGGKTGTATLTVQ